MHNRDSNVYSEWVRMCHWTVWLIKINTFNLGIPICKVARNTFPCIITVTFLNTRSNEWAEDFFTSDRDLIGIGSEIMLTILFVSYFSNIDCFRKCLWGPFKPSPMLFDVGGLFGIEISIRETTGLTWSNLENIFKIYSLVAIPSA